MLLFSHTSENFVTLKAASQVVRFGGSQRKQKDSKNRVTRKKQGMYTHESNAVNKTTETKVGLQTLSLFYNNGICKTATAECKQLVLKVTNTAPHPNTES